jgi:hypothetical protein
LFTICSGQREIGGVVADLQCSESIGKVFGRRGEGYGTKEKCDKEKSSEFLRIHWIMMLSIVLERLASSLVEWLAGCLPTNDTNFHEWVYCRGKSWWDLWRLLRHLRFAPSSDSWETFIVRNYLSKSEQSVGRMIWFINTRSIGPKRLLSLEVRLYPVLADLFFGRCGGIFLCFPSCGLFRR